MRSIPSSIARIAVAAAMLSRPLAAGAAMPVSVTVTGQGDTVQVVFDLPRRGGFGLQRQGNRLALLFPGAGAIPAASGDGRAVTAITGGLNRAAIDIAPGARIRTARRGAQILIAVTAPPGTQAAAPPVAAPPVAALPAAAPPPPPPPPAPQAAPKPEAAAIAAEPPTPMTPPSDAAQGAPAAQPMLAAPPPPPPDASVLLAAQGEMPANTIGTAMVLPFGRGVGAAAFRRGGAAWVVFDERHQIDLSDMQDDPVFAHGVVQILTGATLLRFPLAQGSELRLGPAEGGGWTIAAVRSGPPPAPIGITVKPTQFELAAAESNAVVTVPDAETGQNLLVGTLRGKSASIAVGRRVPAFMLDPTWMGVLVEPIADTVTLRPTLSGFVLGAGSDLSPPVEAAQTLADAAFLTRRFEIPTGTPDMLLRRMQAEIDTAGDAPALARGRPRKAAATTLIALGLGVEAQAMLRLASEEDPRLLTDPAAIGLGAIAAILGGRLAEATGIDNPALDGSDEIAFWRAVLIASAEWGAPKAASVFSTTVNLLLAYPLPLRTALLPLVVETMALGGATGAADAVLTQMKDDPALALARAIRLEQKGETADALAGYDAIARGRNRLQASRAQRRATLLRLQTKAMTPAEAANSLESQFLNWRGDGQELALRMQVADLRAEAGEWRRALDLLRETAGDYPASAPMIQARMADFMARLIQAPASNAISPLDMVAVTEENAEIVAALGSPRVTELMADKLTALDLPQRAGPVLERMMRAAPVGPAQANLGARLAAMRLGEGNTTGAAAALAESNAPGLPKPLIDRRSLIAARLAARDGHLDRANAILIDLASPAADELRASILTDAQDWNGAAAALRDLIGKTVPADGKLTDGQQDSIIRLASALSRLGDAAGLRALSARYGDRIDGPRNDMFRLLTAAPITNATDLPRSSSEMALAKAIPVGLAAIGAH